MVDRFADFIIRHPGKILILLILLTVGLAPFILRVPFVFSIEDMFKSDDETLAPLTRFRDRFGKDDNHVLLAWEDAHIYSAEGLANVERLTKVLQKIDGVKEVISLTTVKDIVGTADGFEVKHLLDAQHLASVDYEKLHRRLNDDPLWKRTLVGFDGDAVMIDVVLKEEANTDAGRKVFFKELDGVLAQEKEKFYVGGIPLIRNAFVEYMKRDQIRFIPITAILCNLLLFFLFRSFKPVVFTFASVLLTMIWTFGLMGLTGGTINIITSTLPSLLMVMGVAYAIHFTGRYLEESARQPNKTEAVSQTLRHLSVAIFMTSLTTAVGFLSLLVMKVELVKMYGIYASLGLGISFLMAITFLPALCLKASPMSAKAIALFQGDVFRSYLAWNDRFVRNHKKLVIVLSALAVAASIYGITLIRVNARMMEEMNPEHPEYIANQFFEDRLAGVLTINLMIEGQPGDFQKPEILRKLLELREYISSQPVDNALCFADLISLMNQAMHEGDPAQRAIPYYSPEEGGDERARKAIAEYLLLYEMSGDIEAIRKLVSADFAHARIAMRVKDMGGKTFGPMQDRMVAKGYELFGKNVQINPVGESVLAGHIVGKLVKNMTNSMVLASFIIVIVFFLLFRNLRLGLLAMIPNLLPIMASMAALGYSGITLRTSIVMVFPISLGIAVDDTIHFITRYRAEKRRGKSNDEAITATFLGTGRAIIFTSFILFAGFSIIATSTFPPTHNFGWLSALTMVTALAGDIFLLPALLHIFKPKFN